ncbi:hypothetical protein CXB51_029852 [Gossypium anomalum]|uniref:NB-ARC domain-containing protein n=1 Tax=Gossypium anomalum TaxID=47600 RepID=A0A8J6CTK0_9ROSI|nr:hypothetical protein CXB51_029852 [Gossypium anomalum]
MAELVGPILDVFKFIGSKATKYLKYQREFAEYVGDFKQAQADLRTKEVDIQQQLEDEHHFGKKPKQEAMKEVHAEGHFPGSLLVNDPSTIAVWGMGEIGKTTIMKDVHNRLLKERKFRKLIWVTESKELDIPRLQKNIASQLERNLSDDEDTIIRAGKVSEMLRRQGRHVLILDDVWESFSLEDVGILKPTSENGCKLVLTTRSESIVRSMGFKKVRVPCLPIEEAINLFLSKVGRDMLPNPTLESFMKLVVRECDGLPLVIVTLAGYMRGVIDPRVWENAVDELRGYIRNIRDMEDKVHGCLKLSYERLKQRDRECFLYCALYPEDYEIAKNELIEHWMEEGLINEMESRKSMESSGYSILQNLEENCLLERGERNYKNSVHMHDVVRDMALHITWKRFMVKARMQLKELPNVEEWSEDLEKISLMHNFISIIPQTMKFPKFSKLTTLLLSYNSLKKSQNLSLSTSRTLRFLIFLITFLRLQALKKLNLRSTAIKEIPQGLEMLVNLRYLNLGCTGRLKEIPTGLLSKLCRLQYLVIHLKLKNTEEMRELNKLEVFEGWFSNVGDLSTYAAERKMLYAYSILVCPQNNDMLCMGVRSLNDIGLRDATDLKKIVVETCNELEAVFSSKCHLLQTLEFLILERLLNLNVIVGARVQESSVGTFSSLKVIALVDCYKIKKLFAADWVLHNLENLTVSDCSELEEIITEPEGEGMGTNNDSIKFNFPKLRILNLSNLPKLKGICSENAVMVCNSLQVIEISYCLKVKRIPIYLPQLESPSNTLQEIRVNTTAWWESVEWEHPILKVKKVVQPLVKFCNGSGDWIGSRFESTRFQFLIQLDLLKRLKELSISICSFNPNRQIQGKKSFLMAELVGPILEVIKVIGRPARKYLKYQRKFTVYVADFKQAQDDLLAKKADIQRQLDEECDHGKMPKQEVERWFKKLVDETTHALKEVQAEGNFSGRLVVNDPSIVAVKLPTQNLVGHQVSVRDEIYGLIREAKFKKLIWITVSRNLDIQSIQKDIASQQKRALPDHENTIVRAGKLSETLREQGRYALILDDVWSSFPLEDIGINELTKVNGCIVLTTRSEEVIRSMGCKKVQVACLSMHEAMDLFLSKVGQDVSANPTLESFMKLVVGECDGLPLAHVTLAASMKGISNPRVWKNVVNELRGYIRNIQDIEDKVFGSLKFSYDRLKKEDQDRFSYCALYPEDHQIEKEEIIQYWMEGLIDEMGSRKAMEDNGHSILEKFEQNCLLERVENSAYVKMHDVFRDMALHIKRKRFMVKAGKQLKELPNEEEWGEDLEKVSLMYNSISAIPQHMKCPKFPKLTTLLPSRNSLREIPESFFEHFPNLKILDLSHNPFESLPSSISALEKLTALLLNGCYNLESLPSVLKLQALKKLRLRGSGIKEIPQGLEMLVNLRYLDLLARHPILRNPEQMREFNKLQVFEGWFCNMGDWNMYVGQRKKLYKYSILVCPLYPSRDIPSPSSNLVAFERIEINSGDAVMLPYDIQQLHLKHCYGARSLNDIRFRDAIDLKECTVEDCFDLESIFSSKNDQLKKLKSLTLRNLADLKVLVGVGESSLGTFSSLKEITLCSCPKIKKLFAADWALHNLEKIEVSYCLQLEEIITETEGEGMGTSNDSIKFNFPKLKTLILSNLRKLKGICSENAVMVCKSLQVIEISNCPKVNRIPLYLPQLEVDDEGQLSPFNTLQEIRVRKTDWWGSVEWEHPNLNVKNVVQPLLKFCNRYKLEWRPGVEMSWT